MYNITRHEKGNARIDGLLVYQQKRKYFVRNKLAFIIECLTIRHACKVKDFY